MEHFNPWNILLRINVFQQHSAPLSYTSPSSNLKLLKIITVSWCWPLKHLATAIRGAALCSRAPPWDCWRTAIIYCYLCLHLNFQQSGPEMIMSQPKWQHCRSYFKNILHTALRVLKWTSKLTSYTTNSLTFSLMIIPLLCSDPCKRIQQSMFTRLCHCSGYGPTTRLVLVFTLTAVALQSMSWPLKLPNWKRVTSCTRTQRRTHLHVTTRYFT